MSNFRINNELCFENLQTENVVDKDQNENDGDGLDSEFIKEVWRVFYICVACNG